MTAAGKRQYTTKDRGIEKAWAGIHEWQEIGDSFEDWQSKSNIAYLHELNWSVVMKRDLSNTAKLSVF